MQAQVLNALLPLVPFAAEVLTNAGAESLAKYGLLGAVLAWFMVRNEKSQDRVVVHLEKLEHKMSGLSRTMLIEILSREGLSERAKRACHTELQRVAPDLADEMRTVQ